jgi:uncharacterized membrane protein
MLEYLIKVTVNTFPAVVPSALLVAAIYRIDGSERKKYLSRGVFLGLLAAFVYAALKRNTGFAVREYYDLGVLAASIASEALLVVVMWRYVADENNERTHRERKTFFAFCAFIVAASWTAYTTPDILLFPFEFHVGMDTVFNTEYMFKASGYSLGLLLAFITAVALFRVASSLSGRALAAVLTLSVLALLARDALAVTQILLGRNLIPRYSWLTGAVIWMLTHENVFVYALMTLSILLSATHILKMKSAKPTGDNPAQVRKKKSIARRQVRFCATVLLGVFMSLIILTAGVAYSNKKVELSPPAEVPAADGMIFISLDMVNDGNLHRFVHKVVQDGAVTDVRYIIIQKNETSYGVGFDACDVCGASGYFQRKGQVVCILCDVVMNKATIGLPGGCNPVPLAFTVGPGGIVIRTDDLAAEVRRFY